MSLALRDRLLLGGEAGDAGDRAEGLLVRHRASRGDAGDHGRLEELRPSRGARRRVSSSAPRSSASATWRCDLLDRRLLDQRADVDVRGSRPSATTEPRDAASVSRCQEVVVDRVLDEDPVGRDAGLAGVAVLAEQRAGDGGVEVGVVEDDERRVAAELERDLLDLPGALGHQQLPDLGRAGEAELAHERVRRSSRAPITGASSASPVTMLEHARRAARPPRPGARRRARVSGVCSAGFSTIVQPARERRRRLARQHRRREVPRRDAGGDADRLLRDDDAAVAHVGRDRVAVDALGLLAEPLEEATPRRRSRRATRPAACPARSSAARRASSWWSIIRSAQRRMIRRALLGQQPAPGRQRVAAAASSARRVSAAPMRGTSATISPVAGIVDGEGRARVGVELEQPSMYPWRRHEVALQARLTRPRAAAISAQVATSATFCHRVVQRRVLPLVVGGRGAVGGDDDRVAGVGGVARGVLDRHVRPGAGDDQRARRRGRAGGCRGASRRSRSCASSRRRGRRPAARGPSAGAAPHVPRTSALASLTPWKSGAFCFRPGAPGLDDVPDVDHRDARRAAGRGEALRRSRRRSGWSRAPARRSRRTRRPR